MWYEKYTKDSIFKLSPKLLKRQSISTGEAAHLEFIRLLHLEEQIYLAVECKGNGIRKRQGNTRRFITPNGDISFVRDISLSSADYLWVVVISTFLRDGFQAYITLSLLHYRVVFRGDWLKFIFFNCMKIESGYFVDSLISFSQKRCIFQQNNLSI